MSRSLSNGIGFSEECLKGKSESVEDAVVRFGGIWVLKGAGTIVAFPDGETFVHTSGNPGMGTGGSGDVLSGMMVFFVSQKYPLKTAIPMAVYLHGKAGDFISNQMGPEGVIASGMATSLGKGMKEILSI